MKARYNFIGIATQKNVVVKRCTECKLLFQIKRFRAKHIKHCGLCTYEKKENEGYRKKVLSEYEGNIGPFYTRHMEMHIYLDGEKKKKEKFRECKVVGTPNCERVNEYEKGNLLINNN